MTGNGIRTPDSGEPIVRVTGIKSVSIANDGNCVFVVTTTGSTYSQATVVLSPAENRAIYHVSTAINPVGADANNIIQAAIAVNGTTAQVVGYAFGSGLVVDDSSIVETGAVTAAPEFTANSEYLSLRAIAMNNSNQILASATMDDSAITGASDESLLLLEFDGNGDLVSEEAIIKEGDIIAFAPPSPVPTVVAATLPISNRGFAINDQGDVVYRVFGDQGSSTSIPDTTVIFMNDIIYARSGGAAPGGGSWGDLSLSSVDINNNKRVAILGEDGNSDDLLVVRFQGGSGNFLTQSTTREGDAHPAVPNATITSLGVGTDDVPIRINDSNQVLWWSEWSYAGGGDDEGVFLGNMPIVRSGDVVNGRLVTKIVDFDLQDRVLFDMSENGEWVVVGVLLEEQKAAALVFRIEQP